MEMPTVRANIAPRMLRWARERVGKSPSDFADKFPKLPAWELGELQPTLKQVEAFAKATYTPLGFLFLSEPPVEQVPIPDFRTVSDKHLTHSSPNLLDTVYVCQQRQAWYQEFARINGEPQRDFVGSVSISDSVESVADKMRHALNFDLDQRRDCPTWTDALRHFISQADKLGVLVMCSGVVRNNTHRPLDPEEFRGFALADSLAPLVFINGADTKAAQMFTLAHELAHIWLGQSALSNATLFDTPSDQGQDERLERSDFVRVSEATFTIPDHRIEAWCNRVAAELLAPLQMVRDEFHPEMPLEDELARLARSFKVSSLVVLRRLYDAGGITADEFHDAYRGELERIAARPKGSGGNFYLTQAARASRRFARALVASTLEGNTLYRDAFQMLGVAKIGTFNEMGRQLGFYI